MTTVSRRQLVHGAGAVGLGLLAACDWLRGRPQPAARVPRIGYLSAGPPPPGAPSGSTLAFLQGLRDLGYVEGQNIAIEYRWADGELSRLPDLTMELLQLNVDVILAAGSPAALAAKSMTRTVPIVFGVSSDPVGSGLVESLARPGGNVTGPSIITSVLSAKHLELLKETVAEAARIAVLDSPTTPVSKRTYEEAQTAAEVLRLQLQRLEVQRAADFQDAFVAMTTWQADALLVLGGGGGNVVNSHRAQVAQLAAEYRLPAMYAEREFVDFGGLMAYGPSVSAGYRRAAAFVDKILKGAKPADLPVEQAMQFEFVINLKTAQALGLTLPHHVLLQATEVIQ
jgi:putative tryptophan/tyrosine transport system substrate-binding protein